MAPIKSLKVQSGSNKDHSASKINPKQRRNEKAHRPINSGESQSAIPGVQKTKALLRQTRRLLAKDKLAADVRVATERKLRALEKDLVEAERIRKEKKLAARYHKVKFFEKQKVTRKISQVKKQLEISSQKVERKTLKQTLFDLRVDLNYIQHYPRTRKYISLFPPEIRGAAPSDAKGKNKEKTEPGHTPETDTQREGIRRHIREMMERGQLSSEPEMENNSARVGITLPVPVDGDLGDSPWDRGSDNKQMPSGGMEDDEFFGNDSADDEEMSDS